MDYSDKIVMIIDDEMLFRQTTGKLIEFQFGCSVVEAVNPKQAFELMKGILPDLILLDMEMPVMDGFTALKHIRNIPLLQKIPVIVFTALVSKQLVSEVYRLGAIDYIVKPSNPKSIAEKIERAFQAINAEKEKEEKLSNEYR